MHNRRSHFSEIFSSKIFLNQKNQKKSNLNSDNLISILINCFTCNIIWISGSKKNTSYIQVIKILIWICNFRFQDYLIMILFHVQQFYKLARKVIHIIHKLSTLESRTELFHVKHFLNQFGFCFLCNNLWKIIKLFHVQQILEFKRNSIFLKNFLKL